MKAFLTLPLLAALSAVSTVAAQEFVLIVRVGAGDLELNTSLARAIANEPEVEAAVRKRAGDQFVEWSRVGVDIPSSHGAGTFQLHLSLDLVLKETPDSKQSAALVDAARKHIEKRIGFLFYEEPIIQLSERRAELTARLAELMAKHAICIDQSDSVDEEGASLARAGDVLNQRLVETRLELATEEQAYELLQKMRENHRAERDACRNSSNEIDQKFARLQTRIQRLDNRIPTLKKVRAIEDLQEQLGLMNTQAAELESQRAQVAARALDLQQTLASVLEKLPTSSLTLQRARTRLQGLESELKNHQKRCRAAAEHRERAFSGRVDSEGLAIEIGVCKKLLAEVQTKLARMQPVRFQVLRPQ